MSDSSGQSERQQPTVDASSLSVAVNVIVATGKIGGQVNRQKLAVRNQSAQWFLMRNERQKHEHRVQDDCVASQQRIGGNKSTEPTSVSAEVAVPNVDQMEVLQRPPAKPLETTTTVTIYANI